MVKITPAILTNDLEEFRSLIKDLSFTDSIDIDIVRPPFVENTTLQIIDIKDFIDTSKTDLGFHLMVDDPKEDLYNIYNSGIDGHAARIYLHQESNLEYLKEFEWPANWLKAVSVKLETDLLNLDFYNQFAEVQFMSIKTGWQGSEFNPKVLDRIKALRDLGYKGNISVDGGINLETIHLIKDAPINRISVGSYFTKAEDKVRAFKLLEDALAA